MAPNNATGMPAIAFALFDARLRPDPSFRCIASAVRGAIAAADAQGAAIMKQRALARLAEVLDVRKRGPEAGALPTV